MPSFLKPSFGFSSFGWRNSGVTTDEAPDEAEGNEDENVGVTFAFAFSICRSASRGSNTTSLF